MTARHVHAIMSLSRGTYGGDLSLQRRPAVHGFKVHVGADADTALVEEVSIASADINDGKAGPAALPDNPGEVFADSACRGNHFRDAVRAKGGVARIDQA